MFSRLIEGYLIGWVANPDMMTVAEAEKACHALVDLLLGEPRSRSRKAARGN